MITDLDLALACEATYAGNPQTWGTDTIHVYRIQTQISCIIAFEGTSSPEEWAVDFEAIPVEARAINHARIGLVHLGWWNGVASVSQAIITYLMTLPPRMELGCTGHSKGAGEALPFAALARTYGIKWSRVSTFGTPHCGALNGLITSEMGCDYRNHDDPICHVPFYLPRPRAMTNIASPDPQYDPVPSWGPLVPHHIQNYIAALKSITE